MKNAASVDLDTQDEVLKRYVDQFESFLDATDEARAESELCRDYKDGKQWTEDEEAVLRRRGQAAIVNNRVGPKVKFMVGEQQRRRRKPKAWPRTPDHEDAADAATDALRYIVENNDFKYTSSEVFEDELVEGYGGVIIEVEKSPKGPEVKHNYIAWDRIYYDPHSRRKDFKDAKYMGIVLWLDESEVKRMFPDKMEEVTDLFNISHSRTEEETFDDRPLWIDKRRKRLKVCQHYSLEDDVWNVCYFTEGVFLIEPKPSPYLDEHGEPENPMELQSAFIDRDNDRFGEVKSYISLQREINHRHSKYLHLLSVRQTYSSQDAVKDVQKLKNELAKPHGHLEFEHGEFGKDFGVLPTGDMAAGQFTLLQEAKGAIDSQSVNAALDGTESRNLSGRAIIARQQGGMTELGQLYDQHRSWELRVYRQTWNRVKQFWTAEKWIRVTDNETNLKWVGLNQPQTYRQQLEEKVNDQNTPPEMKEKAIMLLRSGDPRLDQIAEVKNRVAEMDVDIIIEDGEDSIIIQQEQFETMAQLAQVYGPEAVPFKVMLQLSSIPQKDQILDMLENPEGDNSELMRIQQQAQQIVGQLEQKIAQLEQDKSIEMTKLELDAKKVALENEKLQLEKFVKGLEVEIKQREVVQKEKEIELKGMEISSGVEKQRIKTEGDIEQTIIKTKGSITEREIEASNRPEPEMPDITINMPPMNRKINIERGPDGITGATVDEY